MSEPVHMPALLADEFGISRSEGRRLLNQGAVFINDTQALDFDIPAERLIDAELRIGRRRTVRLGEHET